MGAVCAMIADSKGRSALGFFFVGFFLGCIGLIIILCLDNVKEREERHEVLRRQNQRLREQLKKDRAVADRRHQESVQRLTAHDRALGLDTNPRQDQLTNGETPPPGTSVGYVWHYVARDQQRGPIEQDDLIALYDAGNIDDNTLVWRPGLSEWGRFVDQPELGGEA